MDTQYNQVRYEDNPGYRLLHTIGARAGESVLPYLHYSLNFMLLYFKHGTGTIKIEGRHYNIDEGDLIMLNTSELYQFTVDNKLFHERITLGVNEALLAAFPDACSSLFAPFYKREKGIGNRICAATVKEHGIDIYLDDILKYVKSSDSTAAPLTFCKIIELLAKLNEIFTPADLANNSHMLLNPLIKDVLSYLNIHFKENISISDIAEEFSIDKSYLSHLFKEHVGMSLWTYVIFRRIQLFNSLISKNSSIEDTCYQVGFQNYSNFFRLYKKYMNMTPAQFKSQIKSGKKMININSHLV